MIGVELAVIFLGPPLWFTEVKTGYMYTGPFIGALLGFVISGLLADWSAKYMVKRNKGIYEPEFRILLVVAQLVFGCVGLYGFGAAAANVKKYGWFWPDFFFALEVIGMVLGAVASALYIVDAHRESSLDYIPERAKGGETDFQFFRGDRGRSLYLPAGFQESFQLRLDLERVRLD